MTVWANVNRYPLLYKGLTCKRSSKSRAASFFMADALLWNFRMVEHPKVGTFRNLGHIEMEKRVACDITDSSLSSWIELPPSAISMRTRWLNSAFHTPNPISCSKSTTKRLNMLVMKSPRRFRKEFWKSSHEWSVLRAKYEWNNLRTVVGK